MERILVYENEESLWKGCFELLQETVGWVAGTGHRPGVILSGGGTFVPLYASMGDIEADIFLADERMVPEGTGPDTGAMINREWRSRLIESKGTFYPVERLDSGAATAAQYAETIKNWTAAGGYFAAALLGVGSDGHTASLFEGSRKLWERSGEFVVAVPGEMDPLVERVTLTPALFDQVSRHIVVMTGSSKIDIAKRWLKNRENLPIASVRPAEERFILLDRVAARDLDSNQYELR